MEIDDYTFMLKCATYGNSTCILDLIGAPKNLRRTIRSRMKIPTAWDERLKISPRIWGRSHHQKGIFNFHNSKGGYSANSENSPQVMEKFSFSTAFSKTTQLKTANYLNHATYLLKNMEICVENGGNSFLELAEVVGLSTDVAGRYTRSFKFFFYFFLIDFFKIWH